MSRSHWLLAGAVLLPMLLQALALFNPDMVLLDCEERYNAGHALMLVEGHADAWLRLQYRNFCGGCSLTALAGAGIMGVFGTSWLAWKGVALAVTGLLAGVGYVLLDRQIGRAGAIIWVLLLCLAPLNWIRLSLLSWGNHIEAGVLAVCILAMLLRDGERRWQISTGALCGGAIWFGFSSVFAVTGAFLYRALQRRWSDLGWMSLGVLSAPMMWMIQWWNTDQIPFGTIYQAGESTPSLARIPFKAWTLIAPQQLAGLWGLPNVSIGLGLGIAWSLSLLAALGACAWMLRQSMESPETTRSYRLPLVAAGLFGIWLSIYLVVGFGLQLEPWPLVAAPPGLRYAAPIYPVLFLLLAAVAGLGWQAGRRRTVVLLLAGPLLSGLLARAATLSEPFPSGFSTQLQATDAPYFRLQASYILQPDEHMQCTSPTADSRALHAYSQGRQAQRELLGEIPRDGKVPDTSLSSLIAPDESLQLPWYEGVGGGLVDNLDGSGEGTLMVLRDMHSRLEELPSPGNSIALDEALWRRVYRSKAWSLGRGELTELRLLQVLKQLEALPTSLQEGWLRAYGRRWGRVHARLAQPSSVPFPALPADAAAPFAHGLGQGLGAEWGPRDQIPSPTGMDGSLDAQLLDGYARGLDRQWREATLPSIDRQQAWPDAEADRWWGPAPPMLCPCNSTCE
jgi:hypothetical protein